MSKEQTTNGAPQSGASTTANANTAPNVTPALSEETLHQLERICEQLGAAPERSPQMARQLVKRARQLASERDWSEARALEYLLSLMFEASATGAEPQSPH